MTKLTNFLEYFGWLLNPQCIVKMQLPVDTKITRLILIPTSKGEDVNKWAS